VQDLCRLLLLLEAQKGFLGVDRGAQGVVAVASVEVTSRGTEGHPLAPAAAVVVGRAKIDEVVIDSGSGGDSGSGSSR
jgi:hypothetical protein